MAKVEPTNGNVVEVQSDDDSVIDRERNDAGSETVRVKKPEAQLLTTQGSYLGKGLAKTDSYFGDQAEDAPAFYTYVYRNLNARYVTIVLCGLYALQLFLSVIALGLGQWGNGCAFAFGCTLSIYGILAAVWTEGVHLPITKPWTRSFYALFAFHFVYDAVLYGMKEHFFIETGFDINNLYYRGFQPIVMCCIFGRKIVMWICSEFARARLTPVRVHI